jgi:hypothetical protein
MLEPSALNILSFDNIVMFYRKELLAMIKGKYAKDVFNEAEQNSLMERLVFIPCYRKRDKYIGTASIPTCLARMILSGFVKIDREKIIKELEFMFINNEIHVHVCKSDSSFCFHCYLVGSLCELYYKKGGTIVC